MDLSVKPLQDAIIERRPLAWWSGMRNYASKLLSDLSSGRIDDPDLSQVKDEEILEKVSRDAVCAKAMDIRCHQSAGREWYLKARNDDAKRLLPYVKDLILKCENFDEARQNLVRGAVFQGMRWAKMAGEYVTCRIGGDVVPKRWWVPKFLIDIDKRNLRIESRQEKFVDAAGETGSRWRFHWVIRSLSQEWAEEVVTHPEHYVRMHFHVDEASRGYGRGLLESLYFTTRAKNRLFEFLQLGLERFAYPWISASMAPGNLSALIGSDFPTEEARQEALIAALGKMRSSQIMVVGENDKIVPLDLGGNGNVIILSAIQYCDKCNVERILGSSMPSGGGEQGSFARASVEAETTNTMIETDRVNSGSTITRDLISAIVRYNAPNFREMHMAVDSLPDFKIGREQSNDHRLALERLERLKAAGLPTNAADWYDAAGYDMPDDPMVPKIVPGGAALPTPAIPMVGAGAQLPQPQRRVA